MSESDLGRRASVIWLDDCRGRGQRERIATEAMQTARMSSLMV